MRSNISLNGDWDIRQEDAEGEDWRNDTSRWPIAIPVPQAWELTLGPTFDGACWYRKRLVVPEVPESHRVWLRFEAAATHANVWLNGREIGRHSGDWTPFEFDVTDHIVGGDNLLVLRVEEDRDHVTRGFTCIAMPHAGGIWQDARLEIRPARRILEPICVSSDFGAKLVNVSLECDAPDGLEVEASILREESTKPLEVATGKLSRGKCDLTLRARKLKPWRQGEPNLYLARVRLLEGGTLLDEVVERFGFREVRADGRRILLNDEPIYPRGWLCWGVYPEHIAPAPTPEQVRKELTDLKDLGFNMAKMCLWLPPRYYFDIADELGVFVWIEYPAWQTADQFGPGNYPEWDELFLRDRNRPCVIIRSLTCESKGADVSVMRYLYNRAHELIPGSLIMNNSGFLIGWSNTQKEMFTDLYSDHPYYDCQDFNRILDGLVGRLRELPEKPFVTGESMDCDTYRSSADFRSVFGDRLPWWLDWGNEKPAPLCRTDVPTQEARERQSEAEMGKPLPRNLTELSYQHALAHHKYQVEEYRKREYFTGYTLIGVRDSVGNTPGFYDDLGRLKWTRSEMLPWNNDTVLLMETHRPHQNFRAGETAEIAILVSCFDSTVPNEGWLRWVLAGERREIESVRYEVSFDRARPVRIGTVEFDAPECESPEVWVLSAELALGKKRIANSWRLWILPDPRLPEGTVIVDSQRELAYLAELASVRTFSPEKWLPSGERLIVADCITNEIAQWLESGGRAVICVPPSGALPTEPSGFWREATEIFVGSRPLGDFPHEGFVDLQFLPLSSPRRLASAPLNGKADILIRRVNPRDFLYGEDLVQIGIGSGALIASPLNLGGDGNFTGAYMLSQLAKYAASDECRPTRGMTAAELLQLAELSGPERSCAP